jgi:Peptidase family C25/FlgD Ig-like domain
MKRRAVALRCSASCLVVLLLAPATHAVDRAVVRPDRSQPSPPHRSQLASLRSLQPSAGPFAPTSSPSLEGSPVEYLIITSEAMRPAFERLANWKTAKGVPAVVRTREEIEATSVHGADLAETLRLYIRDAYLYWGVRFVLLGGDSEVLPPRYAATEFLGLRDPPTDLYYSCLDGDWNANGNGVFGEPYVSAQNPGDDADLVSEVFVGRAPVSTLAEANRLVDKTLTYEHGVAGDFAGSMLLMAEVLFPVDWTPGTPVSIDGASFAEALRVQFVPPCMRVSRLYQTYENYPGSRSLTRQSAIAAIDSGFCIAVHIGHGYRYTLSMGDASLDVGDAANFQNGDRSGLFYMLNCTAAAFDFECFAEAMLLGEHGGATLIVGSTREAYPLAASDYQFAFFDHLFNQGQERIGEVMSRSREEFVDSAYYNTVDRWTQLCYTLLGDPETPVRTCGAEALTVTGPSSIAVGSQVVQFTVTDANGPVAGALVCAAKPGDVYRAGRTDAAGHVSLELEPRTAGTLDVTVTSSKNLAAERSLAVTSPLRALVVAGAGLVDDGAGSGAGNSDGRLDAGETVRLSLPLHNAGSLTASGITSTLTTTDPDVQVLQGASAYPDVPAAGDAEATTPFSIAIGATVPDQRVITLVLHLTHDASSETRQVDLVVHAARPELVGLRIDDARAGDGDGVQDPNEEIDLYYTVVNRGTGSLEDGALELTALNAGIDIVSGTAPLPTILPGSSLESTARLTVRESDVTVAHSALLVLRHLQDPSGQARRIDLRPPGAPSSPRFTPADAANAIQLEWSPPIDPDALGYVVYRSANEAGPFARVNDDIVRPTSFRDTGLQLSSRYAYRVAAVDSTLLEGPMGGVASASTNPLQLAGWPNTTFDRSSSTIGIGDVDADGVLDLVAGARGIYAWNAHGIELRDADLNPITWGLLYGQDEVFGSITIADIDRLPGKEIVAATWDPTVRYVVVLHGDGVPATGWPQPLVPAVADYRGAFAPPIVVNLDDQDGPEILLAARDGRIYGWHADGREIIDGDSNPATHGVFFDSGAPFLAAAPGVADLDPTRPGAEIVFGTTTGVLDVLDSTGHSLPGWPRTTDGNGISFGGPFTSGISIADLDQDGTPEMIVLDYSSRLHAMHLDATELAGYPVSGILAHTQAVAPSPAIGDLAGDTRLEVAIAGTDGKLFVFDSAGQPLLPGGYIDSGAATESSPILGDVDGDPEIEIVLGNEAGVMQAWNLDGSPVQGFPILLRAEVRSVPQLGDFDGDGNADLEVLAWDGIVRAWDLGVPWRPERAPWPMHRGNANRTGEYGYAVPTPVTVSELRAELTPAGAVRISWRAAGEPIPASWRIHRAGPFATRPLGISTELAYNDSTIGERSGAGSLEYVDPNVEPGAWYAYVLGSVNPAAGGTESLYGPLVVEVTPRPARLRIVDNVPNPFNPSTSIRLEVPFREGGSPLGVELVVFDAQGRTVRTLLRSRLAPGQHAIPWDGRDDRGRPVASGVYVARITADGLRAQHKLTLIR